MTMRATHVGILLLALGLSACGQPPEDNADPRPAANPGGSPKVYALYDPSQEIMPLPNDLVWLSDGNPAVDLPVEPTDSPEMVQLKQLVNSLGILGLSPNMFLSVPVSGPVDTATLQVRVFRTDAAEAPRTQADFEILSSEGVVKLLPRTPFTPGAAYAVAVKSPLLDREAFPVAPAPVMNALKSTAPFEPGSPFAKLEGLRAAFNAPSGLFSALEKNFGWTRSDVLVLWTFHVADRTLSLAPATAPPANTTAYSDFSAVAARFKGASALWIQNDLTWRDAQGRPSGQPVALPAAAVLAPLGISSDALDKVYFGVFQSPNLAGGGGTPVSFLITTPKAGNMPYPVVVFQHGIGRTKEDGLALANTLAARGLALLAIDAPYHGGRAVSGKAFFTTNLLSNRLNFYQAGVDLWEAFDVITETGVELDSGHEGPDLSRSDVSFASLSLGSIVGSVFLSQDARARRIVLANPAAQLANVFDETARADLQGLVASLGYRRGTTPYYVFLNLAQWLLDPIDATYMKVGTNAAEKLLSVFAFGDPIVNPASTRSFYAAAGLAPPKAVEPSLIDPENPATFPPAVSGAYVYGGPGAKRVIHAFFLSPLFDLSTEPYYAGYDPALQVRATFGAQVQTAAFLAP